jgi:hypothetical protein
MEGLRETTKFEVIGVPTDLGTEPFLIRSQERYHYVNLDNNPLINYIYRNAGIAY